MSIQRSPPLHPLFSVFAAQPSSQEERGGGAGHVPLSRFPPKAARLPGQPSSRWQSVDHLPLSQGLISGYPSCPRLAVALGTPLSMETPVPPALRKNFCSHQTWDTKHPCCWCHQKVIHSFSQYLLGPHCVAGCGPATGRTAVRGKESRFLRAPVSHLCLQEALPQAASRLTELSVRSCLAFSLRCSGSRGSVGSLWGSGSARMSRG